jgi:hypothetical protein
MTERKILTKTIKERYRKADKKKKSEILTEFCESCGYNRSYARRILGCKKTPGRKKRYGPKKRIYDYSVFVPLRKLWIIADGICGQRLAPYLPELIRVLEEKKEIRLNKKLRKKLTTISASTIDRMLKATKKQYELKGKSTTKPGTLLRSTIAVRTFNDWDDVRPGFFETDTVAFCGASVKGEYINGLNLTDVSTAWVVLDAVMGKGQYRIFQAIDQGRQRLFFPMLGLDPDNGTEFINWILKRYCEKETITFTRIRPNRKNDNCYVEQKNYTVLRRFLGYARYDTEEQLAIIKELLRYIELYVNFFQPVMKLEEKQRIGAKVKKKYDEAKTPYQRLLDSGVLTPENETRITQLYHSLNPVDLKRNINKLTVKLERTLRYIFRDSTNT